MYVPIQPVSITNELIFEKFILVDRLIYIGRFYTYIDKFYNILLVNHIQNELCLCMKLVTLLNKNQFGLSRLIEINHFEFVIHISLKIKQTQYKFQLLFVRDIEN